jgi:putative FmdB family regulatory protein
MPIYTYSCVNCGYRREQRRAVEQRNQSEPCPSCQKGDLKRGIDIPGGLLINSKSVQEKPSSASQPAITNNSVPTATIKDCVVDSAGLVVQAAHGHIRAENLSVKNTSPVFAMKKGVKLEMKNVTQDVSRSRKTRKSRKTK